MIPHLTRTEITSFLGHVVALGMVSDDPITEADVRWWSEGDAVTLRRFNEKEYGTCRGVLITLTALGEAKVFAEYKGKTYEAKITVRERRECASGERLNYYIGDLHDHTSKIHKRHLFAARTGESHIDFIKQISEENKIDFTVMSDHGDVVTERDFIGQFLEYDAYEPKTVVILPGSESEATVIEKDRLGIPHHDSGEIVMLNANNYSEAHSWDEFYSDFRDTPLPIGTFAHPQVLGGGNTGLWNHRPDKNATAELKRIVKLIEMGDGSNRAQNILHEYSYSFALDYGFRVSPTCSSDSHGPIWGYNACPGKTVIMSDEKSAEAFISALNAGRAYATESGNIKLYYTVNGIPSPAEHSSDTESYNFHVEIDYFHEDESTHPEIIEVISDFGKTVYSAKLCENSIDFTLKSSTARYFYLRLIDRQGRKTWSAPTYLGRAPEVYTSPGTLYKPLSKEHLKAYEEYSLTDAGALFTEDIEIVWVAPDKKASIVIDLTNPQKVAALGHYAERLSREKIASANCLPAVLCAGFVAEYRLSSSLDGVSFSTITEGVIRNFGGEEIISFPETVARFLRFEVLATVGDRSGQDIFLDAHPKIAELTVFTK